MIQAVLFDVDFTLALPGPELGADGYRRLGERHGLVLDVTRLDEARERAFSELQRQPDLVHDEELWLAFTELIIRGMGGNADAARDCAADMVALRVRENERGEPAERVGLEAVVVPEPRPLPPAIVEHIHAAFRTADPSGEWLAIDTTQAPSDSGPMAAAARICCASSRAVSSVSYSSMSRRSRTTR